MVVCVYDGTVEGLFTAVFELCKNKINPDVITSDNMLQWSFDTELFQYPTDGEKARRIAHSILKNIGRDGYNSVLYASSSCKHNKGKIIFDFLNLMFKHKKDTPFMLSNPCVHNYLDISRSVALEIHRMHGFIHFAECADGSLYANYSPDNDITRFIMPHFTERFNSMKFIIHDVKRNVVGIYNGEEYFVFQNEGTLTVYLSRDEEMFSRIWKSYYQAV